jgi:hypothetical protein
MLKDRDVNTMHEENGFHCFEDLDLETREEIEFSLYATLHHGDEYAVSVTVSSDSNSISENDDSGVEDSSIVLLDSNPSNPCSSSSSSCDSLSSDDSDLQVLQEPQMKLNISGSHESTVIDKCSISGHFPTYWKAFSSKRWTPEMIENE